MEKKFISQIDFTIDNISDGFVSLDNDWCYTFINKKAGEFLGRKPSSLIGKNIWTEFPDGVGLPFYHAYYKAAETQETQYLKDYYEPLGRWFDNRIYPSKEGLSIYFTDITENKIAKDIILQKERELNIIYETLIQPIFILKVEETNQFKFISVNNSFLNILNISEKEIINKSINDIVPELSLSLVLGKYKDAIQSKKTIQWEETIPYKTGVKTAIITISPLLDSKENCTHLVGIIYDITERKKAEEQIVKSEKYLENIINNIGDPIFVKDDQSHLLLVNDAFCKIFKLEKKDIIGKTLAENVTPEEKSIFFSIDKQVISTGVENINEETLTINNEETKIISTKKTRFIDDNNNKYLIGIIRDITSRKQAELLLQENEKSLLEAQKIAKIGSYNLNLKTQTATTSITFNEIVGLDANSVLTFDLWRTITHPEDIPNNQKVLEKCIRTGEKFDLEYKIFTKNKRELKWIHGLGEVIYSNGEAINFFGTIQDITDRKKIELDLKYAKDFSEGLILTMAEGLAIVDLKGISLDVNKALCDMTGFTKEELLGIKAPFPYWPSESYEEINLAFEKTIKGEDNRFHFNFMRKNGERFPVSLCAKPLKDKDDNTVAFFATVQDLTEQIKAEHKIIQANLELSNANIELSALRNQLEQENIYLRNELDLVFNYEEMVYGSAEFSNVLSEVEKVALTSATVLLLGESGTGKELLARAVHKISLRSNKPLIKVNCSAIPRELIESELFGHKKGSFTGASSDKIGKFELADGGTLFLDEIGELPLDMQPKILRFLQEGEIEVVGGTGTRKLDVRIIAATNRNLKEAIEKKQFREDLYFRLNVFPIVIPPLRERIDDIPLLVEHFVDKFNKAYTKNIKYISDAAMAKLKAYNWPGNVRELENLIERASILSNDETLVIPGFETEPQKSKLSIKKTKNLSLDAIQRNHIVSVLERCDWKISGPNGASILLGLKPSTLRDKMSKLGIKKQ
ncbi:sigma 54-interacting transcriptional regulator [Gaetbulibacter aquiaggeris]|uniref:Sigma 54-interacting transcriptional regulator n=1 Tax=Gaetbulibacter aquiaggeris TaxID=1735373 RepID=A0ABW7MQY5_9FLAO